MCDDQLIIPPRPPQTFFFHSKNSIYYAHGPETRAALTHHVVEALRCKLSRHFLYRFFKHREGLLRMKHTRKKVWDVCIREHRDPAREAGSGVTRHSSHAAGAMTIWIHSVELGVARRLLHTELSTKALSSVSRLLRQLEPCRLLTLACIMCWSGKSPQTRSEFKWQKDLKVFYCWSKCCG